MEYQLQFNYCAVLIYSIVLFTHLSRKQTKEKHNRIFTILILIGLTGGSVNILNTYGNMNPGVFHQVFLNLLNQNRLSLPLKMMLTGRLMASIINRVRKLL